MWLSNDDFRSVGPEIATAGTNGLRIKAEASTNLEEVRRSVVVEAGQEAGDAVRAAAG